MRSGRAVRHRRPDGAADDLESPRVVIADDDVSTRTGVRLALEQDGFVVCAEESTAPDAVAAALGDAPDLCVLDVDMPGNGIAAAGTIRSRLPDTHVVILSESARDEDLFAALEAGVSGYLLKDMDPARLGRTLHGVLRGEAALPRRLTARLMREFCARARQPSFARPSERDLTSREWEVLDCLTEGLSTRRIARRLFISETTVRRHVGSILRKLEVSSREEAVRIALQRSRNLNGE